MRARMKRRQRMRTLTILSVVAVVIVVVVIAAYLYTTSGGGSDLNGKQVSSAVYGPLYRIAQTSYASANTTLMTKVQTYNGSPFTSGQKPIVVYIGADYCPYCAFQRWALVVSLMRFGNFSSLRYMQSSPTDVFPNTATFTFDGSKYSSNYIVFQGYEQEDRSANPLQTVPPNYTAVFSKSPFNSAYPFIDVANKYVVSGSFFFPDRLVGLNWTQIVGYMGTNSQIASQVESSADVLTALICHETNGNPTSVCSNPSITFYSTGLTAFHPESSAILMAASPSSTARAWANVQYGQMAWRTKTSVKIR
jgi:hypothetical protein